MTTTTLDTLTHFINGEMTSGRNEKYGYVYNPSAGEKIATVPFASAEEVDETVQLAKQAQVSWVNTSVGKRVQVLFRFRELMVQHTDELAALIAKENGKTISDAKGEIGRGIESVDLAIGAPHILKGELYVNVGGEINVFSIKQLLGVVYCISSFKFPI